MQTIYLDISNKGVIPTINAKQGDVGRKFKAVFTDAGTSYKIPDGAAVSVWYSGASGEGNYTEIGEDSAISVSENTITVELITQMLTNPGAGILCLVISSADGDDIGSWNIPYNVEHRPGMGSAEAQAYFTAFSNAVQNLPYPDASLSVAGKAADAAAVGKALAGKAPAGYVSEKRSFADYASALAHIKTVYASMNNNEKKCLFVDISDGSIYNGEFPSGAYFVEIYREWDNYGIVEFINSAYVKIIVRIVGTWGDFCYENPHMTPGVEYRTTERWNGEVKYKKLLSYSPSSFTAQAVQLPHGISNLNVGISASVTWNKDGAQWRDFPSVYHGDSAWNGGVYWSGTSNLAFELGTTLRQYMAASGKNIFVTVEYTKNE